MIPGEQGMLIQRRKPVRRYGTYCGRWGEIPIEAFQIIVKFLDENTWVAAAQVCKAWRGNLSIIVRAAGEIDVHKAILALKHPTISISRTRIKGIFLSMKLLLFSVYAILCSLPTMAFFAAMRHSYRSVMDIRWDLLYYASVTPFTLLYLSCITVYTLSLIQHARIAERAVMCRHVKNRVVTQTKTVFKALFSTVESDAGRLPSPASVVLYSLTTTLPVYGLIGVLKPGSLNYLSSLSIDFGYIGYSLWVALAHVEWEGRSSTVTPFACLTFLAITWCDGLSMYLQGLLGSEQSLAVYKVLGGVCLGALGCTLYTVAPNATPGYAALHAFVAVFFSFFTTQLILHKHSLYYVACLVACALGWSVSLYRQSDKTLLALFCLLAQPALITLTALTTLGPAGTAVTLDTLFIITLETLPCIGVGLAVLEGVIKKMEKTKVTPWPVKRVEVVKHMDV